MHGPHDHQSLFYPAAQLDILDAFGHTEEERAAYARAYAKISELEARREALLQQGSDPEGQIELLTYRIKEIESAAPVEGEEEAVLQEHTTAGSAQRIMELTGGLVNALTENEDNAFNALASMQRPLEELERLLPAAVGWREETADLATRVQALDAAIRHAVDHIEADPARMEWLDQRLSTYRKLQRKYGATVAEILGVLETSKSRLDELEQRDERLKELDAAWSRLREDLLVRGRALGAKRRIAAASLAEAIVGELEFLGFPNSAFAVDLAEGEPKADGMDEVEFGFAPNIGESMRPLRTIASSGEISRVMLAIKAVLAQHDRIPVLVFDEIDANLGGEMGHAVGRELAGVADRHQVLCITHLPQVAVHGTTHFAVAKQVQDGRTFTRVRELDAHGRIEEVARMLGGGAEVRASVEHARELLFRARREK
jgi:DNA repair protein RecN (Recombination protein N)